MMIRVENLKKSYGKTSVLRGVDLDVATGEQCVVRGSSGSGKSTLLYLLGGLDQEYEGSLLVDGREIGAYSDEELALYRNRNVGFVFQFHYLLPSMNCLNNILLPARIGALDVSRVQNAAKELGDMLGVSHCFKKYPYEISGGEQQRINVIRALSLRPKMLLCDEPTGNLDSVNSDKVIELIRHLTKEFGATLVLVTHDEKVAAHFPRQVLIEDGKVLS